jgi:hypothetical protein
MSRRVIGGLVGGALLCALAGAGLIEGVIAGLLTTSLLAQLGPRSLVEKVGAAMTAALIAWAAGPGRGAGPGFVRYLLGWLVASSVIAYGLHPTSE